MAFEDFEPQGSWLAALITWIVTALFIHFAARIVLDRSSFLTALLVALLGTLLAVLVGGLITAEPLGTILAVVTWILVCALFYRTGMLKAGVIGLVAWVLYFLVTWLLDLLID